VLKNQQLEVALVGAGESRYLEPNVMKLEKTILIISALLASLAASADELTPRPPAGVDTDKVRRIMGAHHDEFKDCHRKARASHKDLHGRLRLHFRLDRAGNVVSVSQSDDKRFRYNIDSPELRDCAIAVLKKINFAPAVSGDGGEVSYSLVFPASD
jgi:hypothetical protein